MGKRHTLAKEKRDTKITRHIPAEKLKTAPCQDACPAGIDVPRYIRYIIKGLFEEALAVNRERIPLPDVCGYACFNPCENRCAMNQFGEPVAIRALKRIAAERSGDRWKRRKKKASPTGKRVAIVGAGPCGLAAAYYLSTLGHKVTLFDSNPEAGGAMRYGIPRYRLPQEVLYRNIKDILRLGVSFKSPVVLGKDITVDGLKKDFDAVLIAIGATKSKKIELDGMRLQGVLWGLEFLQDVAKGKKVRMMEKVLIVGGGNVAIDVALTARRLGAGKVDMVCLEKREEMPAHEWEIARAEEEGVTIHNSWGPIKIAGRQNVKGVEFKKCDNVFDKKGAFHPHFDENTRIVMGADQVIFAIGQTPDSGISSTLHVQGKNLMTGEDGVFAAGDFVTGPLSIIHAIAQGRSAAEAIDKFLGGSGDINETLARIEKEVEVPEARDIQRLRQPMPLLPVKKRLRSFAPVELGYTTEMAKKEAKRCLNCDARLYHVTVYTDNCKACGYCAEVCRMDVFAQSEDFNKRGVKPMQAQNTERCVGCLKCFYACPDFSLEVKEVNLDDNNLREGVKA